MSSSSEFSEFSGNKAAAKSPEKTTFSQTCSLLSQYIKEKGSFGDLTLGMTCNNTEQTGAPETSCQSVTTMNLFPAKESNMTPKNLTPMNLLSPQEIPTLINNSSAIKSVSKGAKASQLTIFYAGQVIVLDDFPADKASELMSLATKGTSQSQNNSVQENQPSFAPSLIRTSADSSAPVIPGVNIIPCTGTNSIPEHAQVSSRPIVAFQKKSRPIVCDLPIARKASLHRFLEKRKDRIAAKAPYEVTNLMGHANKPAESMSWLGFGTR